MNLILKKLNISMINLKMNLKDKVYFVQIPYATQKSLSV